jgi:hypothetical protein
VTLLERDLELWRDEPRLRRNRTARAWRGLLAVLRLAAADLGVRV